MQAILHKPSGCNFLYSELTVSILEMLSQTQLIHDSLKNLWIIFYNLNMPKPVINPPLVYNITFKEIIPKYIKIHQTKEIKTNLAMHSNYVIA